MWAPSLSASIARQEDLASSHRLLDVTHWSEANAPASNNLVAKAHLAQDRAYHWQTNPKETALPNLASVFKAEIARIARKELKSQVEPLRKQLAAARAEVAALKRRLSEVEKVAKAKRTDRSAEASAAESSQAEVDGTRFRFRASGLASNRKRLGLSAEQFGKLVGASGQSVYAWEAGKTVPRGMSLAAIASLRGIGKKEVTKRLAALAQ